MKHLQKHNGKLVEINTMSTPHLINVFYQLLNEAEIRRCNHLRYSVMLDPLRIIYAQDLDKYCDKEYEYILKELINRGHEADCKQEYLKRERVNNDCVLITNYLHIFAILEKCKAIEILNKSLKEVYEDQKEKQTKSIIKNGNYFEGTKIEQWY